MMDCIRRSAFAAVLCLLSLSANARPGIGEVPPPHVGTLLDGTPILLTDYPGKAIVISYWATWCKFCLKEMDILNAIQRVGGDRIQVITVNIEPADVFKKVLKALKPLQVLKAYDPDRKGRDAYGVEGIPHMIIVDKDGLIDSVNIGYDEKDLDQVVESINRAVGPVQ